MHRLAYKQRQTPQRVVWWRLLANNEVNIYVSNQLKWLHFRQILDMANVRSKRFYSVKEVRELLQTASDDDSFSDSDNDRDSECNLSDYDDDGDVTVGLECDDDGPSFLQQSNPGEICNDDSDATVDYSYSDKEIDDSEAATGDVCHDNDDDNDVERENENDALDEDNWVYVTDSYTVPTDVIFDDIHGILDQSLTRDSSPIEILNKLLSDEVVALIVRETNRFAEQYLSSVAIKPQARSANWHPTNNSEMRKFLGLLYLMGIVKKPEIRHYWSSDPVMGTPVVNSIMPRNRFELLLKFLHFSNNEDADPGDRLHKLQGLLDLMLKNFQSLYKPGKEISIDEAMVLWRGRLIFRQYIPGKRLHPIKIWGEAVRTVPS